MAVTTWVMGNWKLNPATSSEAVTLIDSIVTQSETLALNTNLVVAPTFIHLMPVKHQTVKSNIAVMAQDISKQNTDTGAFTGDVSGSMLADIGVGYVLVGHSERREYQDETSSILQQKLQAAHVAGLSVVLCVGEPQAEREANNHIDYVTNQLTEVLSDISGSLSSENLIIAYEPIWAIGTGLTANETDIQSMHESIRAHVSSLNPVLKDVSILYGGSVKPANAAAIANCADVNGALVGGASLNAEHFLDIAKAFG